MTTGTKVDKKNFPQFMTKIYNEVSKGKTLYITQKEKISVQSNAADDKAYKAAQKRLGKGEYMDLDDVKSLL